MADVPSALPTKAKLAGSRCLNRARSFSVLNFRPEIRARKHSEYGECDLECLHPHRRRI